MFVKRMRWLLLVVALAAAGWGIGCSGINQPVSVSPASFFLPGLLYHAPSNAPSPDVGPIPEPVPTQSVSS